MQTSRTAALYGFDDRGLIAPDHLADLNVLDFDALGMTTPTPATVPPGGRMGDRFVVPDPTVGSPRPPDR